MKKIIFLILALCFFGIGIANADICDLNQIYSPEFTYSVPRSLLESCLDGKYFDNKESYTTDEKMRIDEDLLSIYSSLNFGRSGESPLAVLTAGAPGSGKTVLMLRDLKMFGGKAAYIDPDDVSLKKMDSTYQAGLQEQIAGLAKKTLFPEERILAERRIRQEMYDKWRPASNGINYILSAHLIKSKADFYFGMTASHPATAIFFKFLKEQGYRIRLLHLMTPDSVRWESVQQMDKVFLHTTEQDIIEKGFLVPQRILDTYLKYADEIEFYYRGAVQESAQLAAVWVKEEMPCLKVLNPHAYDSIKKIHNAVCEKLNRPELMWEKTVEEKSLPSVSPK